MTKSIGPVIIFGPPTEYQPWIVSDFELIVAHLTKKYGARGVIYKPCSFVGVSGYPGYTWLNLASG